MTDPLKSSALDDHSRVAVIADRLNTITANVTDLKAGQAANAATVAAGIDNLRREFAQFADRSGERLTRVERSSDAHQTIIGLLQDELREQQKNQRETEKSIGELKTILEGFKSDMGDFRTIKIGVLTSVTGFVALGGIMAYVLLK